MESFSNFPLGRNELREYDVLPTTDCGNQPERLKPTGNLALPCCLPPPSEVWVQYKSIWLAFLGRHVAVTQMALVSVSSHQ